MDFKYPTHFIMTCSIICIFFTNSLVYPMEPEEEFDIESETQGMVSSHLKKQFADMVLTTATAYTGARFWLSGMRNPWFGLFFLCNTSKNIITTTCKSFLPVQKANNLITQIDTETNILATLPMVLKNVFGIGATIFGYRYIKSIPKMPSSLKVFIISNMCLHNLGLSDEIESFFHKKDSHQNNNTMIKDTPYTYKDIAKICCYNAMTLGACSFAKFALPTNNNPYLIPFVGCIVVGNLKQVIPYGKTFINEPK